MRTWLLFILVAMVTSTRAQPYSVRGAVTDAKTKQAVSGAKIFINQSSLGALSNESGQYQLDSVDQHVFEVIVCARGYQMIVYKAIPVKPILNIRFELIPLNSKMVTDSADTENRNRYLPIFQRTLLGMTPFANGCVIVNPEVLHFTYTDSLNIVSATADDVLQIINESLGYTINYQLEEYAFNAASVQLSMKGYYFFKPLHTQKAEIADKWQTNRRLAYDGSLMHFMRSLYHNTVSQQGFEIRGLSRVYEGDDRYKKATRSKQLIWKTGTMQVNAKTVKYADVMDGQKLPADSLMQYADTIGGILLNGNKSFYINYLANSPEMNDYYFEPVLPSIMSILSPGVRVQPNGSYFDQLDCIANGYFGYYNLAEKLPTDYSPN